MTSDTPEPQDPARFSRAKSEPPILDLKAEKPEPENTAPKAEPPKHDTLRIEKQPARRWPISGFLGGLIGGCLVALVVLTYAHFADEAPTQIAALESALIEKADRNHVVALEQRLATIEAALAEAKAALNAIAEKRATPDVDLMRRIASLEMAIRSREAETPQSVSGGDQRALRLALVLSLRDAIRNDQSSARELASLERLGEASQAFAILKSNLASPLAPFDEIRAEVLSLGKTSSVEDPSPSELKTSQSRLSSFFAQLVTVRPAGSVAKVTAPEISIAPLVDAVDLFDAKAALAALAALPQADHVKFNSIESELNRRLAVETAITQLLDEALDAIAKGDMP